MLLNPNRIHDRNQFLQFKFTYGFTSICFHCALTEFEHELEAEPGGKG